jgi:hypothetical protein
MTRRRRIIREKEKACGRSKDSTLVVRIVKSAGLMMRTAATGLQRVRTEKR